jgi:hypothetical protein
LPPFIAQHVADQLQLGRHLGDVGAGLQLGGQVAQLLLEASEARFAPQQGELQGVEEQIEAASVSVGITLLFRVGGGQGSHSGAEDLMIVGAENGPRFAQAEPLHQLQMGTHHEVVGRAGRHMAAQEISERVAVQL